MSDYAPEEIEYAKAMLSCPWYRGDGICNQGCTSEPSCDVDRPTEGWEVVAAAATQCDSCGGTGGLTFSPDHFAHFCARCLEREVGRHLQAETDATVESPRAVASPNPKATP